jgi:hypothetical protein
MVHMCQASGLRKMMPVSQKMAVVPEKVAAVVEEALTVDVYANLFDTDLALAPLHHATMTGQGQFVEHSYTGAIPA